MFGEKEEKMGYVVKGWMRCCYMAITVTLATLCVFLLTQAQGNTAASTALGFTQIKDGAMVDSVTGLIWQKMDSGATMTHSEAIAYAAALRAGGYNDWRLPTKFKLHVFYNNLSWKGVDHRNPIFGWGEGDWYWSNARAADPKVIGSAGGLPVAVAKGSVDCKSFKNEYSAWSSSDGKNLVRCVRGRVSKIYIARWSTQLSDKDPSKRWEALLTLGFIEGPEAKEALDNIRKLLTDSDGQIREEAKIIVEKIEKR